MFYITMIWTEKETGHFILFFLKDVELLFDLNVPIDG